MTLVELAMAVTVTAMVTVVLAGLAQAVSTTQRHVEGIESAVSRARVTFDRLRYTTARVGTYRGSGGARHGSAVLSTVWSGYELPDVLVLWTGGRDGDLSDDGLLERVPLASELLIYTASPDDPSLLVEIVDPADTSELDFDAANFETKVRNLIKSKTAESVVICDGVRTADVTGGTTLSAVWFHVERSPSDAELSGVTAGTAAWYALPWASGVVSSSKGLRLTTLSVELQLEPIVGWDDGGAGVRALPFFTSTSSRHVHTP